MSCIYRDIYFESDEFYHLSLHCLSAIQVPLHILGAYIIVRKTPKEMGKVKISMLSLHLMCAWFDVFMSVLAIPVTIFPVTSGYQLGILYYILPTWMIAFIGFLTLFFLGMSILMFFENRYNYLVRKDSDSNSRKIKRAIHYFLNYSISVILLIPPFWNHVPIDGFRDIIYQKLPCLPQKILNNPRLYMLNTNTYIVLPVLFIYLAILWYQASIFFYGTASFIFKTKSQSQKTSHLQKQFFIAICLQVMIPFVGIMIPAIYILYVIFTGTFDIMYCNLAMVWISSHGLFSTIVMLKVHRPYRDATLAIFRLKKKSEGPTN